MKNTMKHALNFAAVLLLTACNNLPPRDYYNRGDPENLLDVSSEVVNMSLSGKGALGKLSNALNQDPPARAQLHCSPKDAVCVKAHDMLKAHGIASSLAENASGGVTLVYERVVARDCENRYIDDTNIPSTLPPPTMGCSLMANTVQMVGDKRQFVNPNLTDFGDGRKAVSDYERYEHGTPSSGNGPMTIYPGATAPDSK